MLKWLRRSMGDGHGGMSAALGALDAVVNPGAARARELMTEQNERVESVPSPGDRLLRDGKLTVRLKPSDGSDY